MALNQTVSARPAPTEVMRDAPVIPVIVLQDVAAAVPLARALVAGGIRMLEVTLRTPVALACIEAIAKEVPEAVVGAGTVRSAADAQAAALAGARFAVSPGYTRAIGKACRELELALLPGVATGSEILLAQEDGYDALKFFPAMQAGGAPMLKAWQGPFGDVKFCPTGGITAANAAEMAAEHLPNVDDRVEMRVAFRWRRVGDRKLRGQIREHLLALGVGQIDALAAGIRAIHAADALIVLQGLARDQAVLLADLFLLFIHGGLVIALGWIVLLRGGISLVAVRVTGLIGLGRPRRVHPHLLGSGVGHRIVAEVHRAGSIGPFVDGFGGAAQGYDAAQYCRQRQDFLHRLDPSG